MGPPHIIHPTNIYQVPAVLGCLSLEPRLSEIEFPIPSAQYKCSLSQQRQLTKKIGMILTHLCQTAIVVLAVVIFLFDNIREKRSVPLTKVRYCMV